MDALQLRNANCFGFSRASSLWASIWAATAVACVFATAAGTQAVAATYQTRNFYVSAESAEIAEQVGQAAESYRHDLAVFWLGKPLPNWSKPCRIRVKEGSIGIGAGGQTTFQFSGGEVYNWNMYVQGSLERILDSVLPHEVNHTIFACHFRRPLPRWADEGAATLFEDRSEQLKQLVILNEVIKDPKQRFSLKNLMSMKEYPKQHRPMLILYAQGYALVDFLIQQKGRQTYLRFLADGETIGWEEAIRKNFDHGGIESLERNWQSWVIAGMPSLVHPTQQPAEAVAIRSQSPDGVPEVSRSTEKSRGDGTTKVKAAGNQHLSMPRRGSVQAPRPSSAIGSTQSENGQLSEQAAGASFDLIENSSVEKTTAAGSTSTAESTSDRPSRLTLTSSEQETSELSEESDSDSPLMFESVHLPRERNEVSGATPQWAGFPGQKQSF